MRRYLVALLGVVLLLGGAAALSGCTAGLGSASPGSGGGDRYVAGDGRTIVFAEPDRRAAPPVHGSTVDGQTIDLASEHGNVVVLNFWASWCAPCVAEAADLEAVYLSTKDDGVRFVGVDSRDDRDKAKAFMAGRITYPSLFDPPGRIALAFSDVATTLPATVILTRSGKVAAVVRGAVGRAELSALVRQLAAES
jgi:thiol-disulfide isomerase/thioredoxin